jgi:hypothetical protein
MTGMNSVDPANRREQGANSPALTVITGHIYWEQSQVFKRWLMPTYRTSFLWTGNQSDAEDTTTCVFQNVAAHMRLPELVSAVDDRVADATLEAACRHWSDKYGVARLRCSQIHACETNLSGRPAMTLAELSDALSAEMRLVIVLRFLRRRPLAAIAAQLGVPRGTAIVRLYTALVAVAERIGLDTSACVTQADQVAAFVDDLVGKRRPLRFEAMPTALAALLAAAHLQAAVAGNNLPRVRFVRSLEKTFKTGGRSGCVTHMRIWTA